MPRINQFQRTSDFGTLKNDSQSNTLVVNVISGSIFNPSNPILAQVTLNVGTINAGLRARGNSSKYAGNMVAATTLYSDTLVNVPSDPSIPAFTQTLYCYLDRISPTTVRLTVATDGATGAPNFRIAESQTITFVFSTFLSPFD